MKRLTLHSGVFLFLLLLLSAEQEEQERNAAEDQHERCARCHGIFPDQRTGLGDDRVFRDGHF